MSQRVVEERTRGENPDMTAHTRSSSQSPFLAALNSSIPAMPALHGSESGSKRGESPSPARPSWLHRSHSTAARLPHAARPSLPGTSEPLSFRGLTSSPSSPLSSSHGGSTLVPSVASYPTSPSGASPAPSRSTVARRQPASRSSHGIETSNGPPPALSTQHSYSPDVARRRPAPPDLILNRPSLPGRSRTDSWIDTKAQRRSWSVDLRTSVGPWEALGVERIEAQNTKDGMDSAAASRQALDDDTDRTLRSLSTGRPSPTFTALEEPAQPDESSQSSPEDKPSEPAEEDPKSKSSQEDLFLDLAKSDTTANETPDGLSRSASKSERRRSRLSISISQQSTSPRQSTPRPSSSRKQHQGQSVLSAQDSPHSRWSPSRHLQEQNLQFSGRKLTPKDPSHAAPSHPIGMGNGDPIATFDDTASSRMSRIRSGSNRETTPDSSSAYGGRQSTHEPSPVFPPRAYRQSNLSYSTNGQDEHIPIARAPESKLGGRRRLQSNQMEDAESVVSTTASSTIWDVVEEAQYRAQNHALTGPPPAPGERPPTASTMTSYISTPPQFCKVVGTYRHKVVTDETKIHPQLRVALAKSKSVMEPKFYQALEATALDALLMAGMTGSVVGLTTPPSPDSQPARPLMHRADSLCHNLTGLFKMLLQEHSDELNADQETHEGPLTSPDQGVEDEQGSTYVRASSEAPEYRSTSQVNGRTEARRRSMVVYSNDRSRQESPSQVNTPVFARRGKNKERPDDPHYYNEHYHTGPHHSHHHHYDDSGYNGHYYNGPPYNDHPYSSPNYNPRHPNDYQYDDHHFYNEHQYNNHRHNHHHYQHDARPVSRAATEIGSHFRPSPLSRGLPEYAPQHPPLPLRRHERSPSVQSTRSRRGSHFPLPPPSPHSQPISPHGFPPHNRQCIDCFPQPPAALGRPSSLNSLQRAELAEVRKWQLESSGVSGSEVDPVDPREEDEMAEIAELAEMDRLEAERDEISSLHH